MPTYSSNICVTSSTSSTSFQIHNVLKIHTDGTVQFLTKPNAAAKVFVNQVEFLLDVQSSSKRVMQKYYLKGIERAIKLAKANPEKDFISILEKEIEIRQEKLTFSILQDE